MRLRFPFVLPTSSHASIIPLFLLLLLWIDSYGHKKVELPNFDGIDPIGWLARAEQYFSINNTRDDIKVQLAVVCMKGHALHWIRWLRQRSPSILWQQLSHELLQRCCGDKNNPFMGNSFVTLASQVTGVSDQQYLG